MNKRAFLRTCLQAGTCLCFADAGAVLARIGQGEEGHTPDDLDRWCIKARYAEPEGDAIRCTKCPNRCRISAGGSGRCRNRINAGGVLYSIAYGNPCAVHIDPVEKKPFFHVLPSSRAFSLAVAGCNLSCLNCQNWQISQASPRDTINSDLMPASAVEECKRTGCASIAYTYTEPTTFFEYAFDTALLARRKGIRNLWKSNGYIEEQPLRDLCRVLDAANIDVKSFRDDTYRRLSGGSLAPVLRTLEILTEEHVWLEVTVLMVPGWTDRIEEVRELAGWMCQRGMRDVPVHLSRFTPLYKLQQLPPTPVATIEKAMEAAHAEGLRYVYPGNVFGHERESTFCPECRTVVIRRRGFTVLANSLDQGKCPRCGQRIAGLWG